MSPFSRISGCRYSARAALVALVLAAVPSGCRDRTAPGPAPEAAGDVETSPSGVDVRVADQQAFAQLLAKYRGRVVLVDFWATWCTSCVRQFQHTVDMHTRYAEQGLAVISVSLDDPDDLPRVREFLVAQRASFANLLGHAGSSAETLAAFDIAGVPHYRVYGRGGALRNTFATDPMAEEQFTPETIEKAIVEALAERWP